MLPKKRESVVVSPVLSKQMPPTPERLKISLHRVSEADWPDLAGRFADLTFEQSLTYARAAAVRVGARVDYFLLEEQGQPMAAAAVRIKTVPGLGRGIAWIAAGPLVLPCGAPLPSEARLAAVLATFRDEICNRGGHILRMRLAGTSFLPPDEVAAAARIAGFLPTSRASLYRSSAINTHQPSEELMTRFHGKWRGHLRTALKAELSLDLGTGPKYEARFLELFNRVQGSKGFERPDIGPEFHFALSGPDYTCEILLAVKGNEDVGGVVAGGSGPTNVYLFGATDVEGRKLNAGYFLAWQGIARTRERGLDWYDLGGMDPETNPDVAQFKSRMNGQPILAEPFEARPTGPVPRLVAGLEVLRSHILKR